MRKQIMDIIDSLVESSPYLSPVEYDVDDDGNVSATFNSTTYASKGTWEFKFNKDGSYTTKSIPPRSAGQANAGILVDNIVKGLKKEEISSKSL